MPGLSLFGREQLLAAFFTPDAFAVPEAVWVALCTEVPTPGSTGSDLVEPEDTAYARAVYGVGVDYWAPTGRGGMANTAGIYFPDLTADYGEVVGWALCDSADGGGCFVVGELASPVRLLYDPELVRTPVLGAGAIVVKQT